jgi:hypothetical protein
LSETDINLPLLGVTNYIKKRSGTSENFCKLNPGRILCVDLRGFVHGVVSLICPIESLLCRLEFPVLFSIKQARRD